MFILMLLSITTVLPLCIRYRKVASKSYGLAVAALAGVPQNVIKSAKTEIKTA